MKTSLAGWVLSPILLVGLGCNPAAESDSSASDHGALPTASMSPPRQSASTMAFVDGFAAGQRAAAASGKPLVLFFTAEWCGYCHEMAREALADGRVVALSKQFVCVRIDADAEPHVCQRFNIPGMPTLLFLGADGRALTPTGLIGKQPAEVVVAHMQAALQTMAYRGGASAWR